MLSSTSQQEADWYQTVRQRLASAAEVGLQHVQLTTTPNENTLQLRFAVTVPEGTLVSQVMSKLDAALSAHESASSLLGLEIVADSVILTDESKLETPVSEEGGGGAVIGVIIVLILAALAAGIAMRLGYCTRGSKRRYARENGPMNEVVISGGISGDSKIAMEDMAYSTKYTQSYSANASPCGKELPTVTPLSQPSNQVKSIEHL